MTTVWPTAPPSRVTHRSQARSARADQSPADDRGQGPRERVRPAGPRPPSAAPAGSSAPGRCGPAGPRPRPLRPRSRSRPPSAGTGAQLGLKPGPGCAEARQGQDLPVRRVHEAGVPPARRRWLRTRGGRRLHHARVSAGLPGGRAGRSGVSALAGTTRQARGPGQAPTAGRAGARSPSPSARLRRRRRGRTRPGG